MNERDPKRELLIAAITVASVLIPYVATNQAAQITVKAWTMRLRAWGRDFLDGVAKGERYRERVAALAARQAAPDLIAEAEGITRGD